jgi:glycosyltransferase involved in cell wall biosynthesis
MPAPKISVIMCVHNGERYLREAIDSILGQTCTDFEFIITDDGSADGTPDIIRSYTDSRIRFIANDDNIGLTRSLNRAIREARGEYIARQDADDVSLPARFAEQLAFMETSPDTAVLGTSVYRINELGEVTGKMMLPEDASARLLKHNQLSHGSVMIRKTVLDEVGGYNELFRYGQDYELWLRIARSRPVRNLKQILYKLRYHYESIAATRRGESLLYHLLAIRLAKGPADEAMLEAIKEKGILSLLPHLDNRELAYFNKELAGMYMAKADPAKAREHYRKAFLLKPFDLCNGFNLMASYAGRKAWALLHRTYEKFRP